ncbi:hypothetical protein CAC42_6845 [Sphaceloma murrayae]|uniref:Uncharacterized protein n=1 Tax=Sphaceloma murrayae TaxID=2082308 RepID=A0A2K1QHF6_9PEZI|nr:hypothetical protein CAC42_6845 [Sphaceloma murrayae]
MFCFNTSASTPVNGDESDPVLTAREVWIGVEKAARAPHLTTAHASDSAIHWESDDKTHFKRSVTMAGGGVHVKDGEVIFQEVRLSPPCLFEAETRGSGARTSMIVSHEPSSNLDPDSTDISLVIVYQLRIPGLTDEAEIAKINKDYPQLARKVVVETLSHIRDWKKEGTLSLAEAPSGTSSPQ